MIGPDLTPATPSSHLWADVVRRTSIPHRNPHSGPTKREPAIKAVPQENPLMAAHGLWLVTQK
jgi:hypothetical protein